MTRPPYSPGPQPPPHGPGPTAPSHRTPPPRIFGIQRVLFVGICLLVIITFLTVVLIMIGDIQSQGLRVFGTLVVFGAFTGLLALDLYLARRSPIPLVIGVCANVYSIAVLMITIWFAPAEGSGPAIVATLVIIRAAAAGAWGLILLGERGETRISRTVANIAAVLLGLVGILLTLHYVFGAFRWATPDAYWRLTVAMTVLAALASSVTVLLYWNRRSLAWPGTDGRSQGPPQPGPAQPAPPQPGPPQGYPSQWPTDAHGRPRPAGPDGRPVGG